MSFGRGNVKPSDEPTTGALFMDPRTSGDFLLENKADTASRGGQFKRAFGVHFRQVCPVFGGGVNVAQWLNAVSSFRSGSGDVFRRQWLALQFVFGGSGSIRFGRNAGDA